MSKNSFHKKAKKVNTKTKANNLLGKGLKSPANLPVRKTSRRSSMIPKREEINNKIKSICSPTIIQVSEDLELTPKKSKIVIKHSGKPLYLKFN